MNDMDSPIRNNKVSYCDIAGTHQPQPLPPDPMLSAQNIFQLNYNSNMSHQQLQESAPAHSLELVATNKQHLAQSCDANPNELLVERSNSPETDKDCSYRKKKKEVYKLETDWLISNVCWSNDGEYKLALASFIEDYKNHVQIVRLADDNPESELEKVLTFEHPYPATKCQWIPMSRPDNSPQLLATTADYLRLWRINQEAENNNCTSGYKANVKLECLLNSNQGSKLCAPLTSFDWSPDASSIVASSVDTTCTVWDISTSKATSKIDYTPLQTRTTTISDLRTQLVAHDNHVYDVAWVPHGTGKDIIVSCSADGSVRLFDLRKLSTSTVLYEQTNRAALVRVSCSRMENNLVATFAIDSNQLIVLDIRNPGRPLSILSKHLDSIHSMSWSPKSTRSICSGSSDNQALIWQISDEHTTTEPLLAYRAAGKINSTSWAPSNIWVAIGYRNCLELLRV